MVERTRLLSARAMRAVADFVENPCAIRALLSWPKFSVTSYFMISRLVCQGVVPRTVLDVGANVGQFAVASAKLLPNVRVHSFEPLPECFEELRRHVSGLGNVTVYPFALGEADGEVAFRANSYSHSSSVLPLARAHLEAFPGAHETKTIRVRVSTLDHVFAGTELRGPVLLKLDVQGYEAQVIRGGAETLRRVDYVILEASFTQMYKGEPLFADLARLMEDQGFRFERPVGWLTAPKSGEVLQMDALFTRDS